MPWVILFLAMAVSSCSQFGGRYTGPVQQLKDGPNVSEYQTNQRNDAALREYVTAVNLYAFYVFNYTKSLNEYAASHGWKALPMSPLCEQYQMPGLMDIPDFMFRRGIKTDEEVDLALADYIRRLRVRMEENAQRVNDAFVKHRAACMY